jgi:cell division initiation protein
MRLSPLDIRQQQFTVRMFRGLDPQEVDAFLEDVAEDYEAVLRENALLREQVAVMEERSRGLAERERVLQDTLVTTQKLADEMKEAARRESQIIIREAELRGEKQLEEFRAEEGRIRSDITALRRAQRHLIQDLRGTLERYGRLLDAELPVESHAEPDGDKE